MNNYEQQVTCSDEQHSTIAYLRTPVAIRERCDRLFTLAGADELQHFRCDLTQLDKVANYVIKVMRDEYPDLNIPFHSRWRHFEVGNVPRIAELEEKLAGLAPLEKAQTKFDLAIISVLLDAGAGSDWQYHEQETGLVFRRSEGLAVASFRMFCQGAFSSDAERPLQADAQGLQGLTAQNLAQGFQVSQTNTLLGVEGRLELLQRLGRSLISEPHLFGQENPRPGNLVNYLLGSQVGRQGRGFTPLSSPSPLPTSLAATKVLSAVLQGLGNIWPGRLAIAGVNLGDVWVHPALKGEHPSDQYVPFHKLSQWLTYSLLEPLQELGLEITGLDQMTGLPEYRNGGLCLDLGLLEVKNTAILQERHLPGSEVIVEWRSLTVSLLDKIAAAIRQQLNLSEVDLPLVKVLQGGTWTAGRRIAAQLRVGGVPPLQIESDGTVF
ncbi:MAG: URC4/urg3 family protein [Symplocastrum torsivum CPER-KK1]|uniref:URC4/urg3 family protein n=1 Tax=Symplocastrum torsivum CPER-KK1 TaxID=450513 RepID=A0A951U7T8_9CYAN|nr:URC4/urg3 family protein [Symplocastrum torsivum CPER-KK1]